MPLGTLDGTPPPFFRQGPSALSKLAFFAAVSVLLLVADARLHVAQPIRAALATAIAPLQWVLMQPVRALQTTGDYAQQLSRAKAHEAAAAYKLGLQSQRAQQVEQLSLENARLRKLLGLRERVNAPALAAQVLYDAADPYTRKVIIDRGALAAVQPGAPVLDEEGVLGQVTRVYPLVSEVTLLVDRQQTVPILDTRSGVRGVAYGTGTHMTLRFMSSQADVTVGDLLTTSGVDGVYPPGLAVARVSAMQADTHDNFAAITLQPSARMASALHVLVLAPSNDGAKP